MILVVSLSVSNYWVLLTFDDWLNPTLMWILDNLDTKHSKQAWEGPTKIHSTHSDIMNEEGAHLVFVYVQLSKIHVNPHNMIIRWNVLGYSCLLIQGEWTLRLKLVAKLLPLLMHAQNRHYVYLSNIWNSQCGIKYLF
jgi:hypothetical protein